MVDLENNLRGRKCTLICVPVYIENDIMYVWLQIDDVGYRNNDKELHPFGGFVPAYEVIS